MNWNCLCGNFVKEKRYCPRCKLVRFTIQRPTVLGYDGYRIGQVANGIPFLLPKNLLDSHLLVSGQTATGKSTMAMNLIATAENQEFPECKFLIMDIEGEWKNIIPKLKGKTRYHSVEKNLKINPFDLNDPALIRELLKQTVFQGIQEEYSDLSAQMNYVLQDVINQSHSMAELIQNIRGYDKTKLTAIEKTKTALLVRLNPFLQSPLREIFYCTKSNPSFERLDDSNIIIDLHSLDAKVAYGSEIRLIYNIITMYYLRKMLNRGTKRSVSNYFVADEAQLLVPRILRKLLATDSWYATTFATRLHKRGCSMILITQSPSNIEPDICKNIPTKISFRLQSYEDIKMVADSAGFADRTELEYLVNQFVKLPQKHAIVSTTGVDPFLIEADDFEMRNYEPEITTIPTEEPIQENRAVQFSSDEKRFLDSIAESPFASVLSRRTSLGWNSAKYSRIINGLLEKRVIEKNTARTGAGSPKVLYQKRGRIPSIRHGYYVDWICKRLRLQGLETETNIRSGADIVIPKLNVAVEVELGKSNMDGNMAQDGLMFRHVIVCSDDKKVIQALNGMEKPSNSSVCKIQDVPALIQKMNGKNELPDC